MQGFPLLPLQLCRRSVTRGYAKQCSSPRLQGLCRQTTNRRTHLSLPLCLVLNSHFLVCFPFPPFSCVVCCSTGTLFTVDTPLEQMSFMQVHKADWELPSWDKRPPERLEPLKPPNPSGMQNSPLQADPKEQLTTAKTLHQNHTFCLHFYKLIAYSVFFSLLLFPGIWHSKSRMGSILLCQAWVNQTQGIFFSFPCAGE